MTTATILALVIALTVVALWKSNPVTTIMASGMWAVTLYYILNNPLAGMPASSAGGNMMVVICMVGIIAMPLILFARNSNERKERVSKLQKEGEEQGVVYDKNGRRKPQYDYNQRDYETRLDGIYNSKRNRR